MINWKLEMEADDMITFFVQRGRAGDGRTRFQAPFDLGLRQFPRDLNRLNLFTGIHVRDAMALSYSKLAIIL